MSYSLDIEKAVAKVDIYNDNEIIRPYEVVIKLIT